MAFMGLTAIGQIPEISKSMLSPNAASLGEYGEVPVSPFTGIPKIEIPLTEIEAGNHKLPISLSYHAGGVRPDQHPGWVGLGWTLNAGGCISRVVKDSIDEYHIPAGRPTNKQIKQLGYYYSHSFLNTNDWNDFNRHFQEFQSNDSLRLKDYDPDEFSFNFLDYHGKFYLMPTGEWRIQCDKPLKVDFNNSFIDPYGTLLHSDVDTYITGYSDAFGGFVITAEDGTRYTFGGNWESIEYSLPFFKQKECEPRATTWNLTKITYIDGREITLNYARDGFNVQFDVSASVQSFISWEYTNNNTHISDNKSAPLDIYNRFDGSLIIPSYLSEIQTNGVSVLFEREKANDLEYDLQEILTRRKPYTGVVYNVTGAQLIPLLWENRGPYSSWSPPVIGNLKWMKLKSISIISQSDNSTLKKYDFGYNDNVKTDERLLLEYFSETNGQTKGKKYFFTYNAPDSLPPYLDETTDHWGFYNATKAVYSDLNNYYHYREPNPNVGQYGILSKITYPTKGFTKFIYEPHDYSLKVNNYRTGVVNINSNKTAGGLRIKTIITKSSEQEDSIVKQYHYVKGYNPSDNNSLKKSSGVLGMVPQYMFNNYCPTISTPGLSNVTMNVFSVQSVLPGTENSSGCHVGYSEVVEENADGSFTKFYYSNFDNNYCDEKADTSLQATHQIYEPYSSKAFERGRLLSTEVYSGSNNNYSLKNKSFYVYEKDDSSSINYAPAVKLHLNPYIITDPHRGIQTILGYYFEGTAYRNYTYLPRERCIVDTLYEQNSQVPFTRMTEYNYNSNKLISDIRITTNSGYAKGCSYTYPDASLYPHLLSHHILSSPVKKVEYVLNSDNSRSNIIKTKINYSNCSLFPTSIETAKGNETYESRKSYEYDCYGNVVHEITDSTQHTVYLWGYKGQYLVAVIKNATLDEVTSQIGDINAFTRLETPVFNNLELLRNTLNNAQVTTYKYKVGVGVEEIKNPNGTSFFYHYDKLGRLSYIKDTNGNVIEAYKYKYAF